MDYPETPKNEQASVGLKFDAFSLAAGLIKADRRLLPSLFALLSLPAMAESLLATSVWLIAGERFVQLAVMSIIVLRWRRRFESPQSNHLRLAPAAVRIFLIGSALWIALTTSISVGVGSANPALGAAALLGVLGTLGFTISLIWCVRLFFYYVVAGIVGSNWRDVITRSQRLYRRAPVAALHCCISPFALTALAFALCYLPYPDGRSLVMTTIASAGQSIFWLLSTYTGIGWALSLFDNSDWRAANLAPYTVARLQTFETQGRGPLAEVLRPRVGYKIALVALIVFALAVFRLTTQPLAVDMSIASVSVEASTLRIKVIAQDPQYNFHGFRPALFSLRSKGGYPVEAELLEASPQPGSRQVLVEITPRKSNSTDLFLEFNTNLTKEHLQALEDLWLWYALQPVQPITKELLTMADKDKGDGPPNNAHLHHSQSP